MKLKISVINGWADLPHCWWRYLLTPFGYENNPAGLSIRFFGFVFFFYRVKK
jgi:hypothetical protein